MFYLASQIDDRNLTHENLSSSFHSFTNHRKEKETRHLICILQLGMISFVKGFCDGWCRIMGEKGAGPRRYLLDELFDHQYLEV